MARDGHYPDNKDMSDTDTVTKKGLLDQYDREYDQHLQGMSVYVCKDTPSTGSFNF